MTLRLIIAGSRGVRARPESLTLMWTALKARHPEQTEFTVIHGDCPDSPDIDGRDWARSRGLYVRDMPADWSKGTYAGTARNRAMAREAKGKSGDVGALFAFWDGKSRGTANMIATASVHGFDITTVLCPRGRK